MQTALKNRSARVRSRLASGCEKRSTRGYLKHFVFPSLDRCHFQFHYCTRVRDAQDQTMEIIRVLYRRVHSCDGARDVPVLSVSGTPHYFGLVKNVNSQDEHYQRGTFFLLSKHPKVQIIIIRIVSFSLDMDIGCKNVDLWNMKVATELNVLGPTEIE